MKGKALILAVVALNSMALAQNLKDYASKSHGEVAATLQKNDMAAFERVTRSHVTADFKSKENGKWMTFKEMLTQMKMQMAMMKVNKCQAMVTKAMEKGNTGTTWTKHSMSGTMMTPDKKSHKITYAASSKDTWVKAGKGWKVSKMEWTDTHMTMDGKPFNPNAMGGGDHKGDDHKGHNH